MGPRALVRIAFLRLAVLLLLGGALGAEASPGQSLAVGPDACALLAPGEIEAALGILPGPGTETRAESEVSLCRWSAAEGLGGDLVYAIVAPRSVSDAAELRVRLAQSIGEPREFRLVEGIGDFAVWVSLMGEPGALQVYGQEFLLQIGIEAPVEDLPGAARALAMLAAARLAGPD